jgi:TDG/mug DNA glycosylase family protein
VIPVTLPTSANSIANLVHAGLPPVATPDAVVLVLGSYPGAQSLAMRRYYAHGQNRFWRTIGTITGTPADVPYETRLAALTAHRIALWDVLETCERPGSMDHAIVRESEVPNDFAAFLERHDALRGVFFNGRAAAALFARHVLPEEYWNDTGLVFGKLPSTSPAHAAMRADELAARWRDAILPLLSSRAEAPRAG